MLIGTHVLIVVLDGKRCVSGCVVCWFFLCICIVSVPKVLRKESLWQSTIEVFLSLKGERKLCYVGEKNIEKKREYKREFLE